MLVSLTRLLFSAASDAAGAVTEAFEVGVSVLKCVDANTAEEFVNHVQSITTTALALVEGIPLAGEAARVMRGVMETIQQVKTNRDACAQLVDRIYELFEIVSHLSQATQDMTLVTTHVKRMLRLLQQARKFVAKSGQRVSECCVCRVMVMSLMLCVAGVLQVCVNCITG